MTPARRHYDAIVIGGGFYGCSLAAFLCSRLNHVIVLEQESDLLTRASLANQARVHNGYHYPRSFLTALRSFVNFPRFVKDYHECVDSTFDKYYAIARVQSKVNAHQFRRVCENIGTPVKQAPESVRRLFSPALVEEVFLTKEYAFDAVVLRDMLRRRMESGGVEVILGCRASRLAQRDGGPIEVTLPGGAIEGDRVYNCTYSGINSLLHDSGLPLLPMKHEIAEIALIEPPREVDGLGITVMDGPFFSTMPFPSRSLYSLSHVRYTPHDNWQDLVDFRRPEEQIRDGNLRSNYPLMIRDAQRYMPCLARSVHRDSLFEVKTVLVKNESDDGRPILFRQNYEIPNLSVIMGGKIDNIYDILQMLSAIESAAETTAREPQA